MTSLPYKLEFYADESGSKPALEWIKNDLSETKRRAIGAAMEQYLQTQGRAVCDDKAWGKPLGSGLFEFRLMRVHKYEVEVDGEAVEKTEKMSLRVFCHAYGERKILILGGYDKGRHSGSSRQQREIEIARGRLRDWKARERKAKKEAQKKSSGGKKPSTAKRRRR